MKFSLKQKAEKWVSNFMLIGCVLITIGLLYVSFSANALGEEWVNQRNNELDSSLHF